MATESSKERWLGELVKIQEWVATQPYKAPNRVVWNIRAELSAVQSEGVEGLRNLWLNQYKNASFDRMIQRLRKIGFTDADFLPR